MENSCEPHFGKHGAGVVAGCSVCSQGEIDFCVEQVGDAADS